MGRTAYWTIVMDGMPTAFRAPTPAALLPVLRQLQRRHPDAVLKWMEAGRLWDSPQAVPRPRAAPRAGRG
ncbi:MAG TPA: hypothetical protein VNI83_09405, partial [Vicinamibacterales bacterium]|nr:hypothetical protein [Vicinamibacterales bacterium]